MNVSLYNILQHDTHNTYTYYVYTYTLTVQEVQPIYHYTRVKERVSIG